MDWVTHNHDCSNSIDEHPPQQFYPGQWILRNMIFDFNCRQRTLDPLFLQITAPPLLIILRIRHIEECPLGTPGVAS